MELDSETMGDVIKRLRRVEGQVGWVIKLLQEGASARTC